MVTVSDCVAAVDEVLGVDSCNEKSWVTAERTNGALAKFFSVAHMRGAASADACEKVEQRPCRGGHG